MKSQAFVRISLLVALILTAVGSGLSFADAAPMTERDELQSYFAQLNGGWFDDLGKLQAELDPKRSYVVLNMIEPGLPMDLRSAELFRRSYVAPGLSDSFNKPALGHAIVAWQCARPGKKPVRGATGLTGEASGQSGQMVKAGWGLTPIVSTYTDGYLQTAESIGSTLQWRKAKERMWSLAVEVEPAQCESMVRFLRAFLFHPSRPMNNFGLAVDPEKMQGGGCGSFASAMANHARLFPPAMIEAFHRQVSAPTSLFGRGLPAPELVIPFAVKNGRPGEIHKVSLLRFLDGPWSGGGPQESIDIVDPELILFVMSQIHKAHLSSLKEDVELGRVSPAEAEKIEATYRRRYPMTRTVKSRTPWNDPSVPVPAPQTGEPWYVRSIPIDRTFDANAEQLDRLTREWWRDRRERGGRSRFVFYPHTAFLVIEAR